MALDLEELYAGLGRPATQPQQRATIEALVADPDGVDLAFLVKPSRRKHIWSAAAEVLTRIGSPRIDAHLPAILEWLQDLTWPGAEQVFRFLQDMDRATLQPHFAGAVRRAREEHDDLWEEFLGDLADARGDLDMDGLS